MQSQVRGLAAALGCPQPVEKTCSLRLPWRWLPSRPGLATLAAATGDPLAPPWPDLLISCGRKAGFLSMALRRAAGGRVRNVHIQDPLAPPEAFDIVVVPAHDRLRGANVLVSRGALHHVTPALLRCAAADFAAELDGLPRPRLAVMIGGPNRHFTLTADWLSRLAGELAATARALGGSLLVTVSRRTPAAVVQPLREAIAGLPHSFWSGEGRNPYLAYLGLADAILVTGDSTSMISEACATGAPVFVAHPPARRAGPPPKRFAAFYDSFAQAGAIRDWRGGLVELPARGVPLNDTAEIAREIAGRLGLAAPGGG